MQTPKEIFMEMLKPDGHPERQLKQYEALSMVLTDPCNIYLHANFDETRKAVNKWGVTLILPEGAPGSMPYTEGDAKVLKDITKWREVVHAPDIKNGCALGWEEAHAKAVAAAGEDKLLTCFMATGIFEQCHFLMGIPDTLTNLYEHPKEMHELIDYITEFRMQLAKMLIDNMHPDAILSHDDWGTSNALFMQPDVWREFFKEPYRKLYGYIRSRGVIVIHHADSYLSPIVEDMPEIGIQCWQGVLPENDIPELQDRLQGRMILMGGIGAKIDRVDSTEEEIREYTKNALNMYCEGGHFIPCITYGVPGCVFKHLDPIINDEIDKYNSVLHVPGKKSHHIARRVRAEESASSKGEETKEASSNDLLKSIASALYKGQRGKVVKLCQEAIDQGFDPQVIINDGLMAGMNDLGNDFTLNKVFVPEMLMAAKAMNAATELLKPLLMGDNASTAGRVCIGTVKGDMHDIGKNLVKIMMEGSGLEVIDLGNDVSAEEFVSTAIDKHCDIICCSSLLTTCMNEMKRVVELSKEKNIRDNVKIFIGGAPISQSFCDEIGADVYTDDAGAAARAAVNALRT